MRTAQMKTFIFRVDGRVFADKINSGALGSLATGIWKNYKAWVGWISDSASTEQVGIGYMRPRMDASSANKNSYFSR
jgi:hypothetical protein